MHRLSVTILQELARVPHAGVQEELSRLGPLEATTISFELAADSIERVLRASEDPVLALRAGHAVSIWSMRSLGVLMTCAPTVRHLISALVRFAPLVLSGMRYTLRERCGRAEISLATPPCSTIVEHGIIDFILAFSARFSQQATPPSGGGLRTVFLKRGQPALGTLHEELLGLPVRFAAEIDGYCFDAADLDLALPSGDPGLFSLLCARAEEALLQQTDASTSARIKSILRECDLESTGVDQLATRLHLSVSSLQRKLKNEQTTFSKLIDEVRCEIALESIERPELSIKALTERLGFSEPSAFYRAFRRWTSVTPLEYRAQRGLSGS